MGGSKGGNSLNEPMIQMLYRAGMDRAQLVHYHGTWRHYHEPDGGWDLIVHSPEPGRTYVQRISTGLICDAPCCEAKEREKGKVHAVSKGRHIRPHPRPHGENVLYMWQTGADDS